MVACSVCPLFGKYKEAISICVRDVLYCTLYFVSN